MISSFSHVNLLFTTSFPCIISLILTTRSQERRGIIIVSIMISTSFFGIESSWLCVHPDHPDGPEQSRTKGWIFQEQAPCPSQGAKAPGPQYLSEDWWAAGRPEREHRTSVWGRKEDGMWQDAGEWAEGLVLGRKGWPGPPSSAPLLGTSIPMRACSAAHLCLTLCNTTDCSPPGFSVHGISQARRLQRFAISSPRGSS